MEFIKEESEDRRIEDTFRVKHEDTETQTDLMALKEDKEVLKETEEKDQYENLNDFITGEKSLCCSQSEKTSTPEEAQKTENASNFTCIECGKGFRFKGSLKRHMMLHSGEKPFTCLQCGKKFSIQQNLTYHLRVHTGERPFTCEQCGSSFIQKVCLKRHMSSHGRKTIHMPTVWRAFQSTWKP
uniref:C2H2-type domain-containing protein n=2 Tax=Cyprinus carpio TaxID=7962 RepID=A0A9J7YSU1_CYPCA